MLLAIDAGNTNIVFAVHDGKEIRAEWRAVTETTRTSDEYAVLLQPLLQLQGLAFDDITSAIIATVVPAALFDLRQLCRKYLKCEPLVVGDVGAPSPHLERPAEREERLSPAADGTFAVTLRASGTTVYRLSADGLAGPPLTVRVTA